MDLTKQPEFSFNLGDKARDIVTGFEGIVIGRHQWLNNCNTYSVKPQTLKDGAPQENHNFDEPQLEIVEANAIAGGNRRTGGPDRKVTQTNRI